MQTNKTTIVSIIIIVVLVIGLLILIPKNTNQSNKIETASTSTLVADRTLHDFGEIDIFSGKVTTEFMLTNSGPDNLTILAGTTSCACTDAEIGGIGFGMHETMEDEFTIPSGASENLSVIYDPLAHGPDGTGPVQRSIFLKTNSESEPELEVRIKAVVTKSE